VNRLELRPECADRHRLVPIVGALLQPLDERFGLRLAVGGSGEEEKFLGILESGVRMECVEVAQFRHVDDAFASGRPRARKDDFPNKRRLLLHDHLGDHSAEREAEKVDPVEAQRADERHGVLCHCLDGVRCRAPRTADAAIVEGDHAMLRRDAVDDAGVPVVEIGGQVIHEDHRYAGIDAQLPVDESSPAHGDRFRRRVLVRRAAPAGARCAQMALGIVPGGSFGCDGFLLR
jgi:hypothetical protein